MQENTQVLLAMKSTGKDTNIKDLHGPVSRKRRQLFRGSQSHFLPVNLYLKTEVCTPETSGIKGNSGHIKNIIIKQLCNHEV